MSFSSKNYRQFGESKVFFSKSDKIRIEKMQGRLWLVSTVCPDYPHNGKRYTFNGRLGYRDSLTARHHLETVPELVEELQKLGLEANWLILVADLPELVEEQQEFFIKIAGSKQVYLERCKMSADCIRKNLNGSGNRAMTFSDFYSSLGVDYLAMQRQVAERILSMASDDDFGPGLAAFALSRRGLAEKFRGHSLSWKELLSAAAHGMSLYATHGSLLRNIYLGQNLILLNHFTSNLRNFRLAYLVDGMGHLKNSRKPPIGIINGNFY